MNHIDNRRFWIGKFNDNILLLLMFLLGWWSGRTLEHPHKLEYVSLAICALPISSMQWNMEKILLLLFYLSVWSLCACVSCFVVLCMIVSFTAAFEAKAHKHKTHPYIYIWIPFFFFIFYPSFLMARKWNIVKTRIDTTWIEKYVLYGENVWWEDALRVASNIWELPHF